MCNGFRGMSGRVESLEGISSLVDEYLTPILDSPTVTYNNGPYTPLTTWNEGVKVILESSSSSLGGVGNLAPNHQSSIIHHPSHEYFSAT